MQILIDTETKAFRRTFTLSLFLFSIMLFGAAAYSWTGPTGTAPNSNVAAPINVSATSQVKSGALSVNGLSVYGNEYVSGNLGVGATPASGTATWKVRAMGNTYGIYADATTGQAIRGYVSGAGYAGYFDALSGGGGGGLFARNSSGYYAYLGYPGSAWSVYSNGNTYSAGYSRADGGFCIGGSCKTSWLLPQNSCYWVMVGDGHGHQYAWGAGYCSAGDYVAGLNFFKSPKGLDDEAIQLYCCPSV